MLDRKILIGHCKGHDTTILIILIDGLKEKTIRLYNKEVCCAKLKIFALGLLLKGCDLDYFSEKQSDFGI